MDWAGSALAHVLIRTLNTFKRVRFNSTADSPGPKRCPHCFRHTHSNQRQHQPGSNEECMNAFHLQSPTGAGASAASMVTASLHLGDPPDHLANTCGWTLDGHAGHKGLLHHHKLRRITRTASLDAESWFHCASCHFLSGYLPSQTCCFASTYRCARLGGV